MKLQIGRFQRDNNKPPVSPFFVVIFVILLDEDDKWQVNTYGAPYLAKVWETITGEENVPFDPRFFFGRQHEREFQTVEDALAFEEELQRSCAADLWHIQQSAAFGAGNSPGIITVQPKPYPSEEELATGTKKPTSS